MLKRGLFIKDSINLKLAIRFSIYATDYIICKSVAVYFGYSEFCVEKLKFN
jgi:hypothetical protein